VESFEACLCQWQSHHRQPQHKKQKHSPAPTRQPPPVPLPPKRRNKHRATSAPAEALTLVSTLLQAPLALACTLHPKSTSTTAPLAQYPSRRLLLQWDFRCHNMESTMISCIHTPNWADPMSREALYKGCRLRFTCLTKRMGSLLPLHLWAHIATATSLHRANTHIHPSMSFLLRILQCHDILQSIPMIRHRLAL
jgi:hypothetical protein